MLIDKYIENALYLYQCVIIPSFGGFVAREQGATNDQEEDKFTPAFKKFTFNRHLRVNDGVLASYIANMREISYAEAVTEISKAVDYWLSRLEKHDSVEIEGVGTIKVKVEGEWIFIPSELRNYRRSSYGLESVLPDQTVASSVSYEHKVEDIVSLSEVKGEIKDELDEILEHTGVVELEQSGIEEELLPNDKEDKIHQEQETQEEYTVKPIQWANDKTKKNQIETPKAGEIIDHRRSSRRHRGVNKKMWSGISIGFIFIVILLWIGWGRIAAFFVDEPPVVSPQVVVVSSVPVQDTIKTDTIQIDTLTLHKTHSALDTLHFAPQKRYYVIAAALRDETKANELLTELASKGYKSEFAGRQKGLYLISYGSFSGRAEANAFLEEMINQVNSDAWIKVYNQFPIQP